MDFLYEMLDKEDEKHKPCDYCGVCAACGREAAPPPWQMAWECQQSLYNLLVGGGSGSGGGEGGADAGSNSGTYMEVEG